jgi:hypothetical protein
VRSKIAEFLGVPEGSVSWVFFLHRRLSESDWEAFLKGDLSNSRAAARAREQPEARKESGARRKTVPDAPLRSKLGSLREEVERLRAEKKLLEREVRRGRAASQLARHLRKVNLVLEKEEPQVEYLAKVTDLSLYFIEAQRWLGTLKRYERHIREALEGRVTIDVEQTFQ